MPSFRKLCLAGALCLLGYHSFAQKTVGGTIQLEIGERGGFNRVQWNVDYHFELKGADFELILDRLRLSVASASYTYYTPTPGASSFNRSYMPADLGFSSWPADISAVGTTLSYDVLYKGKTLRSGWSGVLVNGNSIPAPQGSFIERDGKLTTILIGQTVINFNDFSIADFTLVNAQTELKKIYSQTLDDLLNEKVKAYYKENQATARAAENEAVTATGNNTTSESKPTTGTTVPMTKEEAGRRAAAEYFRKQELDEKHRQAMQMLEDQKREQQVAVQMQHIQDARNLEDKKEEVAEASRLDINHNDIERMEREFEEKMANVSRLQNELTEARQQEWNSRVQSTNWSGAGGQQFGETAQAVGNLINGMGEEKRKREAKEELEKQRQQFLTKIANEKAAMYKEMREQMLSNFKPVMFNKLEEKGPRSVFGFIIAYNQADLGDARTNITVSEVIEVGSYTDGSWPSMLTFTSRSKRMAQYGNLRYFHSKEYNSPAEAEQMRTAFIRLFSKNGTVREVTANADINPADKSTDFWESTTASAH